MKIDICPNGTKAAHFVTACAGNLSYVLSTRLSGSVTGCVKTTNLPPIAKQSLWGRGTVVAATVDEGIFM